jgi:von Willebrand factor type A domain
MSGSVCNGGFFGFGGTGDCVGCPLFECRNVFLDSDTCCDNFGTIKSFSQVMIRALAAEFPAEKGFSIVQFASDASIASLPQSANDALSTVSQLSYSGGVTNHAAAISFCRQSLSSSQYPDRKKFMMLITDGEPTAPEDDPEGAAISAASQAKNDGIFIIPIFISPTYTFDPFMSALSSDGKVFDVTSFDELLSLQESLVNQVSCSS